MSHEIISSGNLKYLIGLLSCTSSDFGDFYAVVSHTSISMCLSISFPLLLFFLLYFSYYVVTYMDQYCPQNSPSLVLPLNGPLMLYTLFSCCKFIPFSDEFFVRYCLCTVWDACVLRVTHGP